MNIFSCSFYWLVFITRGLKNRASEGAAEEMARETGTVAGTTPPLLPPGCQGWEDGQNRSSRSSVTKPGGAQDPRGCKEPADLLLCLQPWLQQQHQQQDPRRQQTLLRCGLQWKRKEVFLCSVGHTVGSQCRQIQQNQILPWCTRSCHMWSTIFKLNTEKQFIKTEWFSPVGFGRFVAILET